ncbi:glycoside hydrolase family 26 protein [Actinomycetes bacterium M1A6_2h]
MNRHLSAGRVTALGAVFLLAAVGGATVLLSGRPDPDRSPTSVVADPVRVEHRNSLRFGVSTPGGPSAVDEFAKVTDIAGQAPTVVLSYADFTTPPPIDGLNDVDALGAQSIVTWEPWRWQSGARFDSTEFSMASIAAGAHDDYLYRWADELRNWGKPIYLRFAHEQNGTWYPWSVAGGTPSNTYVAAWRHVHDVFASARTENVQWVWSPNVSFDGSTPSAESYPGADYVDVVGLDGYNWGTSLPTTHWIAPSDLFGASLDEMRSIAPDKPIVIAEVGSSDSGGDKAQWITSLVEFLDEQEDVTAFVWFDHDKEADWRLSSTPESAAAFADALGRKFR